MLHGYSGSSTLITFTWISWRFSWRGFFAPVELEVSVCGTWRIEFSLKPALVGRFFNKGHGWPSIQRLTQEEKVEVGEESWQEVKRDKEQPCQGFSVSLLLWLRAGRWEGTLLVSPTATAQEEKGVFFCGGGHHWWLLHCWLCHPGSSRGKCGSKC